MTNIPTQTDSPIVQGIKTIGIGKKGSRDMDAGLAKAITRELQSGVVDNAVKGAFLGALFMKGIAEPENAIYQCLPPEAEKNPEAIVGWLSAAATKDTKELCEKLILKETLSKEEAEELGTFLFSNEGGDSLRGLAASILRVRYETPDEYEGLLSSISKTFQGPFLQPVPAGDPVVQISEPFDGVDHSYMITPLLAGFLQSQGYRAVCQCAPSPGPKFTCNLFDIAKNLNAEFLSDNKQLKGKKPSFGWYLNHEDLSLPLKRWLGIRRKIIKRPFLSTLERFADPCKARLLITSAFHPPYGEKMLTIAERAAFPAVIVVRNGLEGTIAFPLKRAAKILCSVQLKSGEYKREEFEFWPEKEYNVTIPMEEKLEAPRVADNIALISEYHQKGKTGNKLFDLRVKATCEGLDKALNWINKNRSIL